MAVESSRLLDNRHHILTPICPFVRLVMSVVYTQQVAYLHSNFTREVLSNFRAYIEMIRQNSLSYTKPSFIMFTLVIEQCQVNRRRHWPLSDKREYSRIAFTCPQKGRDSSISTAIPTSNRQILLIWRYNTPCKGQHSGVAYV